MPFGQVNAKLKEHYGIELPTSAARTLTLRHAALLEREDVLPAAPRDTGKSPATTLIVQTDGTMVPVMEPDPEAPDARKGKKLFWKELRVCTAQREGDARPLYGAMFGDPQEVGALWKEVADANGLTPRDRAHGLGDGATWIASQFDERFGSQGTFLLDFYHVCEYLAAAAKVCAPEDPRAWAETQKTRLKENKSREVLAELNAKAEHSTGVDAEGNKCPVLACLGYLSARHDQLDYAGAIAKDLPIGSGVVESSNRSLIQSRLKRAGAWWCTPNAQAMANLRSARENGQWERSWKTLPEAA